MATVYYKGLTGVRDSVTGITFATTTIDQLVTLIAADEGLPTDYYKISLDGSPTVNDIVYGDSSTKLSAIGFTDGCTVICTTKQVGSKEERQIQKLEIAQLKRSGSAGDGSSVDIPGYRILNTYDRNLLPTKYTGNAITDNANSGGLQPGRPWTSIGLFPTGYVTLAGLTWAPMTTGGTYAQSQTYASTFTGLGFSAGTWRSATVAELQSLTAVLSYADAQNVYGWVFAVHAYNIWSSVSGQIVNFNTGANNGTATTNNFNFLVCKTPA